MYIASDGETTLHIKPQEIPKSPRNDPVLGRMICWHPQLSLGDNHGYPDPKTALHDLVREEDAEDMRIACTKKSYITASVLDEIESILDRNPDFFMLPLFLLDERVLSMKTTPFSNKWNTYQVGWIYTQRKNFEKAGCDWEKRHEHLIEEVEKYNQYLRGDVYDYTVFKESNCDHCGQLTKAVLRKGHGFYGRDFNNNGLKDDLPERYRHLLDLL